MDDPTEGAAEDAGIGGAARARADRSTRRSSVVVEPRFMALDEVAVYLNVSVSQVYALVRSGDLPAVKIGGRGVWRVDRVQLESYIERMHRETQEAIKKHRLDPEEAI